MKLENMLDYTLIFLAVAVGLYAQWNWLDLGLLVFVVFAITRSPAWRPVIGSGLGLLLLVAVSLYLRENPQAEEMTVVALVVLAVGTALRLRESWKATP